MYDLQIHLLGLMELWADGQALSKPPTVKAQSLLAFLLVHQQRAHAREFLADLFWGERPPNKAAQSLATALWHIRRGLGDVIVGDLHTVQFRPGVRLWLDTEVFAGLAASANLAHLQDAVTLYRGDFLDSFYDDWVISERYRFEALYLDTLARLMNGQEVQGDYAAALAAAQRLLACDPLREDGHQTVMRAYCYLGQRNAALDQFRRCQAVVHAELGIEPTSETIELHEMIRNGRLASTRSPDAISVLPPTNAVPSPMGRNPLDDQGGQGKLVGREQEMVRLQTRWQESKAGRNSPVFIRGEAGLGKTRLVREFSQQLRGQGVRVLWGRCYEFERIIPYQPVAEAVRSVLPSLTTAELAAFPVWALTEVGRLAPEIGDLRPDIAARADLDHPQLFDGVGSFLSDLAGHSPILIVLEDLHWATEPTLELMHYLAHQLAGRPALLLLTYRPDGLTPDHPLSAMSRRLSREGFAEILTLLPLAQADVEQFVIDMSGRGDEVLPLARRLYQETEGNPFFLVELVKAIFESEVFRIEDGVWQGDLARMNNVGMPLPANLRETILARAGRMQPDTQDALNLAAVLGREFDFDLLMAMWSRGEEATLSAIDEMLRHRLIQEGTGALGRDYAFSHHTIQETIYAHLSQRRRRQLHARAGCGMERVYVAQLEALAGELAYHFEQGCGHDPLLAAKALRYLWLAGDQARTFYASQDAVDYYQRALIIAKDCGDDEAAAHTLFRLGLTHHSVYDFEPARQSYDEGFLLWRKTQSSRSPASQPPAPHPFRLLWVHTPRTIDPILGDAGITHHVFSGLVEESPEMEVIPDAAWRWEVFDDGRRYLFHLRPDAVWSDGVPVTARDFEFAWKQLLVRRDAIASRFLFDITGAQALHEEQTDDPDQVGVKAVDDLTLSITLVTPAAYFLHLLALPAAFPLPRHVVERWGDAWTQPQHIVSNGAFLLQSWQAGDKIVLVRNPDYRGRFTGNIQEIHLLINEVTRTDWRAGLALYEANEIDAFMIANLPHEALTETGIRFPQEQKVISIYHTVAIGFDTRQPPFDDVRVRKAFAMSVDVKRIRDEQDKEHWVIDNGGWIPAGMPGHMPGASLPYDPDQARQLLVEAGYPGGRGFPEVRYRSTRTIEADEILRAMAAQLHQTLGVTLNYELSERSTYPADLAADLTPVFMQTWWGNYPDPDDWLRQALAQMRRYTGWQNPTYDALVEEARRVFDPTIRMQLYRQAEDLLIQEATLVPMYYPKARSLMKPWLQHYDIPPTQGERGWKAIVIQEH